MDEILKEILWKMNVIQHRTEETILRLEATETWCRSSLLEAMIHKLKSKSDPEPKPKLDLKLEQKVDPDPEPTLDISLKQS